VWPWARGDPRNFRVPYNISATAEASNFSIGMRLGFGKAHHKTPHIRKGVRGPGLEELPKILGYLFNICATSEASNFKFGMQLGFAKANYKTTPRGKVGWARDGPKYLGFPFNISATAALSS